MTKLAELKRNKTPENQWTDTLFLNNEVYSCFVFMVINNTLVNFSILYFVLNKKKIFKCAE